KNLNTDIFEIISTENCSPYIVSLSAKNLKGEVLMHKLEEKGVIIGTGSACSSKNKHSRILTEAGYLNNVLDGVIRISFSSFNTINEITYVVDALNECAENLKRTITISK
ncbi:MAG: aminotransferase class V-fold PLP-dependent enzyme, partial [Clostridia bacterium]|nr:aminotransferase class V-fold PLP-dependent enzyme [Clostridia bacterium]